MEFLRYLPGNTQGVLVQPAGEHGLLVAATHTQRGFGRLDQARSRDEAHLLEFFLFTFVLGITPNVTCREAGWRLPRDGCVVRRLSPMKEER